MTPQKEPPLRLFSLTGSRTPQELSRHRKFDLPADFPWPPGCQKHRSKYLQQVLLAGVFGSKEFAALDIGTNGKYLAVHKGDPCVQVSGEGNIVTLVVDKSNLENLFPHSSYTYSVNACSQNKYTTTRSMQVEKR